MRSQRDAERLVLFLIRAALSVHDEAPNVFAIDRGDGETAPLDLEAACAELRTSPKPAALAARVAQERLLVQIGPADAMPANSGSAMRGAGARSSHDALRGMLARAGGSPNKLVEQDWLFVSHDGREMLLVSPETIERALSDFVWTLPMALASDLIDSEYAAGYGIHPDDYPTAAIVVAVEAAVIPPGIDLRTIGLA